MKSIICFLVLVLLVVSLSPAYAGNERRLGTAGAQELRIPIGARGTAMGGSIIAVANGVEAIHWNPAGLGYLQGTEAMFSHQPYLADIDINFVGVATGIEDFGTLAAAAKVVSVGNIEETTDEFPDGTGRTFDPTLSVLSVTYSRVLTNRVVFGVTGKFIHESIFEVSASGAAFDVGFIYNPDWNGLKLGFAIMNYGPKMRFQGRGFDHNLDEHPARPIGADFDLPSSFNFGMALDFVNTESSLATVTGNFTSNNYSNDLVQGGVEYVFDGKYALRAGYNYSQQESWLYGLSLGAGLSYELGNTLFTFEYSWTDTEVFDNNQYLTAKLNF